MPTIMTLTHHAHHRPISDGHGLSNTELHKRQMRILFSRTAPVVCANEAVAAALKRLHDIERAVLGDDGPDGITATGYLNHRCYALAWLLACVRTFPRKICSKADIVTILQDRVVDTELSSWEREERITGGKKGKVMAILEQLCESEAETGQATCDELLKHERNEQPRADAYERHLGGGSSNNLVRGQDLPGKIHVKGGAARLEFFKLPSVSAEQARSWWEKKFSTLAGLRQAFVDKTEEVHLQPSHPRLVLMSLRVTQGNPRVTFSVLNYALLREGPTIKEAEEVKEKLIEVFAEPHQDNPCFGPGLWHIQQMGRFARGGEAHHDLDFLATLPDGREPTAVLHAVRDTLTKGGDIMLACIN
jgi:hypothetical protein